MPYLNVHKKIQLHLNMCVNIQCFSATLFNLFANRQKARHTKRQTEQYHFYLTEYENIKKKKEFQYYAWGIQILESLESMCIACQFYYATIKM